MLKYRDSLEYGLLLASCVTAYFVGRLAAVPPAYIGIYGVAGVAFMCSKHKALMPRIVLYFLVFFCFYFLYSLIRVPSVLSAVVYFFMWLANVFVFYAFASSRSPDRLASVIINFSVFSVILGAFTYFSGLTYSGNPYLMWNKNSYIFLLFVGFMLAAIQGRHAAATLICIGSLLVFSRTLIVMYLAFAAFMLLDLKRIGVYAAYLVLICISIWVASILLPEQFAFLSDRVEGAVALAEALYAYLMGGADLGIGRALDDHQRFMLFAANLELAIRTFPFGTGLGLDNYLSAIDPRFVKYFVGGHVARAHNFVISYVGEMGLLFFCFLFLLIMVYRRCTSRCAKAGYLAIFGGLLFNEYITSPYVWMYFGLCINHRFASRIPENGLAVRAQLT